MKVASSPVSLAKSLGAALAVCSLAFCTPGGAGTGSVTEEDDGDYYHSNPSGAENPDDPNDGDYCMGSEEGMYNCDDTGDGTGTGDGTSDGTDGTGDGTGTGGSDGIPADEIFGGDCPEDGCPTADGADGSIATGGDTTTGGGSGSGDGSDDGSGDGTGTTDGSGDGTGLPGDPTYGGDCPEDGCPTGDGTDGSTATGGDGTTGGGTGTGDGTDGTGDGTGDDTGTGTPPACYNEEFNPQSGAVADLLLVVDRSGSMDEVPPNTTATKWEQVTAVVSSVVQDLDDELGFGLAMFPAGATSSLQCAQGNVVVPIDDNNGTAVSLAFFTTGPGGGTPTAPTLRMARTYLSARLTDRPQAVVLATDGAPNCNTANDPATCVCSQATSCDQSYACLDDTETVAATQELAAAGLATFVVGIPGSELFASVLDRMADAGGTAVPGTHRYYTTNSSAELESALRNIGQRVAQCRFELAQEPQSDAISVTVNGTAAQRDTTRNNGWDYVGARTIEFFGAACDALASGGNVVVVDYCESIDA